MGRCPAQEPDRGQDRGREAEAERQEDARARPGVEDPLHEREGRSPDQGEEEQREVGHGGAVVAEGARHRTRFPAHAPPPDEARVPRRFPPRRLRHHLRRRHRAGSLDEDSPLPRRAPRGGRGRDPRRARRRPLPVARGREVPPHRGLGGRRGPPHPRLPRRPAGAGRHREAARGDPLRRAGGRTPGEAGRPRLLPAPLPLAGEGRPLLARGRGAREGAPRPERLVEGRQHLARDVDALLGRQDPRLLGEGEQLGRGGAAARRRRHRDGIGRGPDRGGQVRRALLDARLEGLLLHVAAHRPEDPHRRPARVRRGPLPPGGDAGVERRARAPAHRRSEHLHQRLRLPGRPLALRLDLLRLDLERRLLPRRPQGRSVDPAREGPEGPVHADGLAGPLLRGSRTTAPRCAKVALVDPAAPGPGGLEDRRRRAPRRRARGLRRRRRPPRRSAT